MAKIIIIGAGPGGLTAGMLLASRGFDVTIYEKSSKVGGRNTSFEAKGYKFDVGPTFLMMKFILDEVFEEAGRKSSDYLDFVKLDPMYRLEFDDKKMDFSSDHYKMEQEVERNFPGNAFGFRKFLAGEKIRFERMYPCLQKDYIKFSTFFHWDFLRAMPRLSLGKSMFQELGRYFSDEKLRLSFTFQSKYLGMSAWDCPAAFLIIPYVEHAFGVYHTIGGLSEISEAMVKVVREFKGKIKLNKPVKRLIIEGKQVKGVELEDGTKDPADDVIINADFAYAMTHLLGDETKLRRYSPENLNKLKYSCSTFMLYLGVNKNYNSKHHTIYFAKDYKKNINDIFHKKVLSEDISFYIRNASVSDKAVAPKGKSNIYVLVPVPNNKSKIDWKKEKKRFRDLVMDTIKKRTEFKDIDKHIEFEKIITPKDWENNYNVFLGATFNIGHNLMQMLHFRPRNKFEELDNCYLVGGGTHPGSGLPTIYESGRITANLISRFYKIPFKSLNLQVR